MVLPRWVEAAARQPVRATPATRSERNPRERDRTDAGALPPRTADEADAAAGAGMSRLSSRSSPGCAMACARPWWTACDGGMGTNAAAVLLTPRRRTVHLEMERRASTMVGTGYGGGEGQARAQKRLTRGSRRRRNSTQQKRAPLRHRAGAPRARRPAAHKTDIVSHWRLFSWRTALGEAGARLAWPCETAALRNWKWPRPAEPLASSKLYAARRLVAIRRAVSGAIRPNAS